LLAEARKAADSDGVALNQLITLALAEKVSVLRTSEYFEERAQRANRPQRSSRFSLALAKGCLRLKAINCQKFSERGNAEK